MTTKEKIDLLLDMLPYLLPILAYLIGRAANLMKLPGPVARLVKDPGVAKAIREGIEAADSMSEKTDAEKREYVRAWAKSELYKVLGEWIPDSGINLLIEHIIVRRKG